MNLAFLATECQHIQSQEQLSQQNNRSWSMEADLCFCKIEMKNGMPIPAPPLFLGFMNLEGLIAWLCKTGTYIQRDS